METISPHQLSFRSGETTEYGQILAFVDGAFGRPRGRGLVGDFPVSLGRKNLDHIYVGAIDGTIVCAASALVRDWQTSSGSLRTACLGSFSTPWEFRGRGYNAALQQWMLDRLAAEGVDWALLWADQPEVYRGRGFSPVGRETHGRLTDMRWPELPRDHRLAIAETRDAPALLGLYQAHVLRAERSIEDLQAHLHARSSTVLTLVQGREIKAYVALEKGQDFRRYVHEYAGPVELVHSLWGEATRRGMEHVLVPQGAEHYLSGAAERMLRRRQSAALGRILRPDRLGEGIEELRWAAWGFDSA